MVNSLKEHLEDVDLIKDEEVYSEALYEAAREYCSDLNFNLSEADMDEIYCRGLIDDFNYWKKSYLDFLKNSERYDLDIPF